MFADIKNHWKRKSTAWVDLMEFVSANKLNGKLSIYPANQYQKDRISLLAREYGKVATFDYLNLIEDEKCLLVERVNEEPPMVIRYNRNIFS